VHKRLPLLLRQFLFNLRGGFLVRPLSIALVLGCILVVVCYYFIDRPVAWFVHDHRFYSDEFLLWPPLVSDWATYLVVLGIIAAAPRRGMVLDQFDFGRVSEYFGFHFALSDYPKEKLLTVYMIQKRRGVSISREYKRMVYQTIVQEEK